MQISYENEENVSQSPYKVYVKYTHTWISPCQIVHHNAIIFIGIQNGILYTNLLTQIVPIEIKCFFSSSSVKSDQLKHSSAKHTIGNSANDYTWLNTKCMGQFQESN